MNVITMVKVTRHFIKTRRGDYYDEEKDLQQYDGINWKNSIVRGE